jgi:hypothetical protein
LSFATPVGDNTNKGEGRRSMQVIKPLKPLLVRRPTTAEKNNIYPKNIGYELQVALVKRPITAEIFQLISYFSCPR